MERDDPALDVGSSHVERLGNAGAGVIEQSEEQPIALAAPSGNIDGREQCGDLLPRHVAEQRLRAALERHRQYPVTRREKLGRGDRESKARKAADGGQPRVAGANRVVAFGFELVEEREDRLRRQRRERELVNRPAPVLREEAEEQAEGIAVGDRVGAQVALRQQMLGKEPLNLKTAVEIQFTEVKPNISDPPKG